MNSLNKKIRRNRFLAIIPLISFLSLVILPFTGSPARLEAAQFNMSADFLIQMGISFYNKGRFADAMSEFKKVLVIDPHSKVAQEFIKHIQKELLSAKEEEATKSLAMEMVAAKTEAEKRLAKESIIEEKEKLLLKKQTKETQKKVLSQAAVRQEAKPLIFQNAVLLDEKLKINQSNILLEVERESSVLIKGDNIKRFLNISPQKIEITRQDENTLLIKGIGIGKGIFHIWDNSGRWTFNFEGKPRMFFGPSGEAIGRGVLDRGLSEPFKISYNFDWSSFNTGRRLGSTQRQSLYFTQSGGLRGETPYGNYDSYLSVNRLNKTYQVDALTMGLNDAHFWGVDRVNLRIFDFTPGFSAYRFPSAYLRGINVMAPMFGDRINYTVFSGGIPKGNYTQLSPGLGRTKDAFLEGIGFQYKLSSNTKYKFYFAHTHGSELSQPVLTNKAFGIGAFYKIGKLNFDSEVAYDGEMHIDYTTMARLSLSKVGISLGYTDADRDFVSPMGGGSSGGSSSAIFGLNFSPTKYFSISNNFTATRDRRLFNPADPKRPNFTFDTDANLQLDPLTALNFGYARNDTKGSVSPGITQTKRLGLRKQIFFIKRLSTYLNYINTINKYFTSSASNYDKNSIMGGLSFNLIGSLNCSLSKTINFIEDRMTREHASPHVLDASLSYYSRILDTPFYSRFRVSYRDEERAGSALSFLSGEDRLEFNAELNYRPTPFVDGYLSFRVSNIWAELETTPKHLDAEVRYGLRLVWDTGIRWNTEGNIEGFVFNDLNGNGIKDRDEPGVKDVLISSNTKKSDATSEKGYYRIKNIIGKKTRISIDLNTIPRGNILTTPATYDIDIKHGATRRVDFGITSRAEIVGLVFVDSNGNNKFDREEEPVIGVAIVLDGKERVETGIGGQFLFRTLSAGEHTLEIDLKTLPTKYIPKVPLKKKVVVEKGVTFFYNVPLRAAVQLPETSK